jgi:hypothetical protein
MQSPDACTGQKGCTAVFSEQNAYLYWKDVTNFKHTLKATKARYVRHCCWWIRLEHLYDLRISWQWLWRMPSSVMLCHMALVRTDVSKEHSASIIRVTRIGELGTTLAVTSNQSMLQRNNSPILVTVMMEVICFSESSVLTRAIERNNPEDGFLQVLQGLKSKATCLPTCLASVEPVKWRTQVRNGHQCLQILLQLLRVGGGGIC